MPSAAENRYGFLASSGAVLTYLSSEKAVLGCTSHRTHWNKGSSSEQTTSPPGTDDRQASQVSYPQICGLHLASTP